MKKFLMVLLIFLLALPAYAMEVPNIDFGGHVRLRGYNMKNFWTFDNIAKPGTVKIDDWNMFRLQSELHAKADVGDHISAYVRFSNQTYGEGVTYPGNYILKDTQGNKVLNNGNPIVIHDAYAKDNAGDKVFVENAYIDVNDLFNLPVDVRFGRQNLMYGTGFVLFDGQSQFASTAVFFDGVKMTWNIDDNNKLDLFYMKDQENLTWARDDITLTGAYLTAHLPVIGGQQELYVLNRNDQSFPNTLDPTTGNPVQDGKNIYMYGLRLSDKYTCGVDYSGEIAYQNGKYDQTLHIDQEALGYKLELGYTANMLNKITPRLFVGYTYLSGNKDSSRTNNAWDVFYGGWPQYGDLLAWVYVNLPGPAHAGAPAQYNRMSSTEGEVAFTNLKMPKIGISATCGPVSATFTYIDLQFDKTSNDRSHDFGDYYQLEAKYQYSKHLAFAAYGAMIDPGKYFTSQGDHNTAYETFWETQVNF